MPPPNTALVGAWCAALTPIAVDGGVSIDALARHARWLLESGLRGVCLFGTTGEGTAFSTGEKIAAFDALVATGLPCGALMTSTGSCDQPTTVALLRHAAGSGAAGVLALPPFYVKKVTEEGLYRWFAELIDKTGDDRLRLVLYHLPELSTVPLSVALIRRLADAYPGIIAGVKDSSGDILNTQVYLDALPDLSIFVGDERTLLRARRRGGAGTICGLANTLPREMADLAGATDGPGADSLQARITAAVQVAIAEPMVAGHKSALAAMTGDSGWLRTRPPIVPSSLEAGRRLVSALEAAARAVAAE